MAKGERVSRVDRGHCPNPAGSGAAPPHPPATEVSNRGPVKVIKMGGGGGGGGGRGGQKPEIPPR